MGVISMIRNYQNELMIAVAFFVLAGGFLYQRGMDRKLGASLERSKTTALQITEAKTFQKVWSTKGLKQKVSALHELIPAAKIQTFNQKKKKLVANFNDLTGQELNTVSTNLASLPVQIQELAITRTGNNYSMRCTCSW
jgi:glutamate synthase domain-containing protein 3